MLWPHNKKFAVFLSHDVDQARKHLLQALYYFYQQKRFYHLIPQFFDNPYWTFETITKLEEECSVRSTFFFLNESIHFEILKPKTWRPSLGRYSIFEKEITKVIKKLDRGGWEIGLHGSYNSYRDKTLLANEKEDLEKILGKEVYGIRQHYLNLDIPNTWQIQRNLGLRYDASFGFRRNQVVIFVKLGRDVFNLLIKPRRNKVYSQSCGIVIFLMQKNFPGLEKFMKRLLLNVK